MFGHTNVLTHVQRYSLKKFSADRVGFSIFWGRSGVGLYLNIQPFDP